MHSPTCELGQDVAAFGSASSPTNGISRVTRQVFPKPSRCTPILSHKVQAGTFSPAVHDGWGSVPCPLLLLLTDGNLGERLHLPIAFFAIVWGMKKLSNFPRRPGFAISSSWWHCSNLFPAYQWDGNCMVMICTFPVFLYKARIFSTGMCSPCSHLQWTRLLRLHLHLLSLLANFCRSECYLLYLTHFFWWLKLRNLFCCLAHRCSLFWVVTVQNFSPIFNSIDCPSCVIHFKERFCI